MGKLRVRVLSDKVLWDQLLSAVYSVDRIGEVSLRLVDTDRGIGGLEVRLPIELVKLMFDAHAKFTLEAIKGGGALLTPSPAPIVSNNGGSSHVS